VADERAHAWAGAALSVAFAIGVLFYASAMWSSAEGAILAMHLRPALVFLAASLIGAAGLAAWLSQRRHIVGALAALGAGWFGAAIAITVGALGVQDLFSARDLAALIRREASAATTVYSVQNYQQSLPFYLKRTVTLVDYRDEFAFGLRQAGSPGSLSLDAFTERWLSSGDALAVMPRATRVRLSDAGVPMHELACFADRLCLMSRH
jgi:hypothetical protein